MLRRQFQGRALAAQRFPERFECVFIGSPSAGRFSSCAGHSSSICLRELRKATQTFWEALRT
jgi:hypothetical protein